MKMIGQSIVSLHDMLNMDGRKIADVENIIEQSLPVWISKVGSKALKDELDHYLFDVRAHQKDLGDLERNKNNNTEPREEHIKVVNAYIEETNKKLNACADKNIADAYLIYAIQAINHYKINIYGTLAAYADFLRQAKTAGIYHKAMLDEKVADMRLSNIAERNINLFAGASV